MPATTSASMKATISAKAMPRRRASASECACAWSCPISLDYSGWCTASPHSRGHKRPPVISRFGLRPPLQRRMAWWPPYSRGHKRPPSISRFGLRPPLQRRMAWWPPYSRGHKRPPSISRFGLRPPLQRRAAWWPPYSRDHKRPPSISRFGLRPPLQRRVAWWPPYSRDHKRPPSISRFGLRPPLQRRVAWWPLQKKARDLGQGEVARADERGISKVSSSLVLGPPPGVNIRIRQIAQISGICL